MKDFNLGHKLRVARIDKRLSTEAVAEHLGCTRQYVTSLERKSFSENNLFKYLLLLKKKGYDLNNIITDED